MYHFTDARAKMIFTAGRGPEGGPACSPRFGYDGLMPTIPPGSRAAHRQLVTPEMAINFLGPETARVLSTPSLIALFEMTCRNLLREFLPAGQDSVGTWIEVRHSAPTPMGGSVSVEVEVIAVEGRRVKFKLRANDDWEPVAEGHHERYVVDVQRFDERVRRKAVGAPSA